MLSMLAESQMPNGMIGGNNGIMPMRNQLNGQVQGPMVPMMQNQPMPAAMQGEYHIWLDHIMTGMLSVGIPQCCNVCGCLDTKKASSKSEPVHGWSSDDCSSGG